MRIRAFIGISFLVLSRVPSHACIWDSDTLAHEAKGIPDIVAVITGRFERNPPLYYQMRLHHAEDKIKADPFDYPAYDDAGASCDRLGQGPEALSWMERKRKQMDLADSGTGKRATADDRYRHLANVGTFRAHHWFRSGADRRR